ncbi:hypothetical protein ABH931_006779 [Streptacidiphilus sp. MAP12-33]|uniref:hypothetical protein n=1 Tax=Streptacidiphilus sp. MAP12-33 TaxID=3156266 RepID=UPI0035163E03
MGSLQTCVCGTRMRPLLTTDSEEWLDHWPPQGDPGFTWGDPRRRQDRRPTRVNMTRSGIFRILYCPADPRRHPLGHVLS